MRTYSSQRKPLWPDTVPVLSSTDISRGVSVDLVKPKCIGYWIISSFQPNTQSIVVGHFAQVNYYFPTLTKDAKFNITMALLGYTHGQSQETLDYATQKLSSSTLRHSAGGKRTTQQSNRNHRNEANRTDTDIRPTRIGQPKRSPPSRRLPPSKRRK